MSDINGSSGRFGGGDGRDTSPPGPPAASYLGATRDELRSVRGAARLAAMSDQRRLFPHHGRIELRSDTLLLGGWRTIPRNRIADVELSFTDSYSRWMAGGARGGRYASFGLFGSLGKPLVVRLVDEDVPIYLLIDFQWFSGINQARRWFPAIAGWAAQGRTT